MNLREVVADMECMGKPEASENPVLVSVGDTVYSVSEVKLVEDFPVRGVQHIVLVAK